MSNIYETTDKITPMVSFHKSVAIDGGIVAKSASLGNAQCRLVVNDDGIYIVVPSRFDNSGGISTTRNRTYNLGAMVEAIQELNRRTAWMETDMTFKESLEGTDVITDTVATMGASYSDRRDFLPGLKRTIPYGSYVRLVDTSGVVIHMYQIPDETAATMTNVSLLTTDNKDYIDMLCESMHDDDYTHKYISPRISKTTDDSFDILVLDTVIDGDSANLPTLSDKYYTYTPIGNDEYKASLKEGVTFDDICTDDNKVVPPVPYIFILRDPDDNNSPKQLYVTTIAELFKGRELPTDEAIDFSDWDFSKITDTSNMFEGCNTDFCVKWIHTNPMRPAFITPWGASPKYVVLNDNDELIGLRDIDGNAINIAELNLSVEDLPNYIWKGKDDAWFRFNSTKDGGNNTFITEPLTVVYSE